MQRTDETHQCPGTFRKFEPVQQFTTSTRAGFRRRAGKSSTHHVAQVDLGEFVIAEVGAADPVPVQAFRHTAAILPIADLNPDEDLGTFTLGHPVAEFREAAVTQSIAQISEASGLFGDLHSQHRFAFLTQFGTFGNETKPVEIHVGAAGHGHQSTMAEASLVHVVLQACNSQGSCGFENGAGVLEHVLDRGTDRIGINTNHPVHEPLRQSESVFPHLTNRNSIGEQPNLLQLNSFSLFEGATHGIGIHGLHTDNFGFRPELFDVGPNSCNQSASPNGDINGMGWLWDLAHDFQPDRSLPCDHLRVVKRMDEGQPFGFASTIRLSRALVIGFAMENHFTAERPNRTHLHFRCCARHHDHGPAAQLAGAEGDTLRMVTGA